MITELRSQISSSDLHEALIGPWRGISRLPSLSWDATAARHYALRADDPSKEKRGSVPGANWLGVLGLTFLPVFPHRRQLQTTGVRGGWKNSEFTWPVWKPPSIARVATSLLSLDISSLTAAQRDALGVTAVFSARIQRSDQGGYGSFSPARIVPAEMPARDSWERRRLRPVS
jgi:hypothetical protein